MLPRVVGEIGLLGWVLQRVLRDIGGALGSALEGALPVGRQQEEHPREHSPEHFHPCDWSAGLQVWADKAVLLRCSRGGG